MKNVVVEIQGKYAVLMSDAGDFIRIRNRNYKIGQRLDKGRRKTKAGWVKWAVAAAAAVVLLFGGGAYAYYTPYTDVSFDINPSLELSTNIFDTVIDIRAINEDAAQLLKKIQLNGCDLKTAMIKLVDELVNEGYLTVDEAAGIILTASSQDQDRARTMLQDMKKTLDQEMDRYKVHADIQGECIGGELRIRARELGVSPGKLMLAERYAQSTGNPAAVNIKEWLNKPVKDIFKAINANMEQNNGNISANGTQSQEGYTGGDLSENGYNGGDQSDNGQNAGTTDQNGYVGGDQSDNGYNGGEQINNDKSSETPAVTNGSSSPESTGNSSTASPQTSPNNGNSSPKK